MPEAAAKKGWTRVAFVKMAEHVAKRVEPTPDDGATYVGLEHLDSGSLTVRRWGTDVPLIGTKLRMRKGDILFARRNAYLRRVALAPHDGLFSAHGMVLRACPDVVLPEFLPFFMQSDLFMDRAEQISVGSLSPTINWGTLKKQQFALPPLEEQLRIAEVLQAANTAAENLQAAQINSLALRDRMFIELIENGVRKKTKVESKLGSFPTDWTICPLGERYEIRLGKMMSPKAKDGIRQVPYLRNANIQWNQLDLDDVETMSFSESEEEKFALRYGDILACEGRHVGKSALWRNEIPRLCYQKALHRLRPLSGRDHPEYLLHCLRYYSVTGRFAVETGETTIPHLPAVRFRAMLFPFPPKEEQAEIAQAIAHFDSAARDLQKRVERTKHLFSTLVQNALVAR